MHTRLHAIVAVLLVAFGVWVRADPAQIITVQWGIVGDIPIPGGDFDGDGQADIAVYRPSAGSWFLLFSSTQAAQAIPWGLPGDIPVAADYDGDGYTDVAVYRPSAGTWHILASNGTAWPLWQKPDGW